MLVGAVSGLLAGFLTYAGINGTLGGVPFRVMWLSSADFKIPVDAWWWGLLIGAGTALIGSLIPALSARNVKPAEVFAKAA